MCLERLHGRAHVSGMEKVSVVDKVYELEDLHDLRLALVQVLRHILLHSDGHMTTLFELIGALGERLSGRRIVAPQAINPRQPHSRPVNTPRELHPMQHAIHPTARQPRRKRVLWRPARRHPRRRRLLHRLGRGRRLRRGASPFGLRRRPLLREDRAKALNDLGAAPVHEDMTYRPRVGLGIVHRPVGVLKLAAVADATIDREGPVHVLD
mmetsp:Transcript_43284/g.117225  ORF Transcript_43284/g.117225 Transcript_43284/m.117225 type:complete len:210 (+) Transcript_43284:517-1146(+)